MEHSLLLQLSPAGRVDDKASQLRSEYQAVQRLFERQSSLVQQYINTQAASVTEAVIQGLPQLHFSLPDRVSIMLTPDDWVKDEIVPAGNRNQVVKTGPAHFTHSRLNSVLYQRLTELEQSSNRAVVVAAGLLRYAIAVHIVYNMLPAGRSVVYKRVEGDDIPNQPEGKEFSQGNLLKTRVDAQGMLGQGEDRHGKVTVPYVEAARRFYLPQWVAFDDRGELLLSSVGEARAYIASMQHYMEILNSAGMLAPYLIADEIFQQKRYGMLGQLVNQGRALAHYQSQQMILTIKRRVAEHRMDRGLSLSLPYFNDQALTLDEYEFDVIPAGRVMFIPAFVVLAVQAQGAKVAQDTRLSQSTRRRLLMELSMFESAFLR